MLEANWLHSICSPESCPAFQSVSAQANSQLSDSVPPPPPKKKVGKKPCLHSLCPILQVPKDQGVWFQGWNVISSEQAIWCDLDIILNHAIVGLPSQNWIYKRGNYSQFIRMLSSLEMQKRLGCPTHYCLSPLGNGAQAALGGREAAYIMAW